MRYGRSLADEAAAKETWMAAIRALPEMSLRERRAWRVGGKESERIDRYRNTLVKSEQDAYDTKRRERQEIGKDFDALALALAATEDAHRK